MPAVVFQEQSSATVKVSGRDQATAPAVGTSVGPNNFPPPPPPPPVPLIIESIVVGDWSSGAAISFTVTFTEQPYMTGCPNWVPDADPPRGEAVMQTDSPKAVLLLTDSGDSTTLTVPADATGVFSASGGKVTPGVYPVPYPA